MIYDYLQLRMITSMTPNGHKDWLDLPKRQTKLYTPTQNPTDCGLLGPHPSRQKFSAKMAAQLQDWLGRLSFFNTAEVYDCLSDTWEALPSMATKRHGATEPWTDIVKPFLGATVGPVGPVGDGALHISDMTNVCRVCTHIWSFMPTTYHCSYPSHGLMSESPRDRSHLWVESLCQRRVSWMAKPTSLVVCATVFESWLVGVGVEAKQQRWSNPNMCRFQHKYEYIMWQCAQQNGVHFQ